MTSSQTPHFHNTLGVSIIHIGAKHFQCVGAIPPQDHPHIFLNMGNENQLVCPYCKTLYRYTPSLSAEETNPAGCLWQDQPEK